MSQKLARGSSADPRLKAIQALASGLTDARRTIELLEEYGRAKFGDRWWPGHAQPWLSLEKARELHLLGYDQGAEGG